MRRLGIHREIEQVIGAGPVMLLGLAIVALAIMLVLPRVEGVDPLAREDLAFALAVILLGLLMMITRRNAVTRALYVMTVSSARPKAWPIRPMPPTGCSIVGD